MVSARLRFHWSMLRSRGSFGQLEHHGDLLAIEELRDLPHSVEETPVEPVQRTRRRARQRGRQLHGHRLGSWKSPMRVSFYDDGGEVEQDEDERRAVRPVQAGFPERAALLPGNPEVEHDAIALNAGHPGSGEMEGGQPVSLHVRRVPRGELPEIVHLPGQEVTERIARVEVAVAPQAVRDAVFVGAVGDEREDLHFERHGARSPPLRVFT